MSGPQIEPMSPQAFDLMLAGCVAFANTSETGMRVDVEYCKEQEKELTSKLEVIESKLSKTKLAKHWRKVYGKKTNYGSDAQLRDILFNRRKLPVTKYTDNGNPAVDAEALNQLDMAEVRLIIKHRKYKKLRNTYMRGFIREQVNGFLHPFFYLHRVQTYRSSSADPNFQNIPKRDKEAKQIARRAFLPREGRQLIGVDYSGLEVNIATCYHQDPTMIDFIERGVDFHRDFAKMLYLFKDLDKGYSGEKQFRQGAKNGFVFAQFYGDYYWNCAGSLIEWAKSCYTRDGKPGIQHLIDKGFGDGQGGVDREKFAEHVKKIEEYMWYSMFPQYRKWKDKWVEKYRKLGYLDMLTGFRCRGVQKKNEIINTPIQGSAFHCTLWSYNELDRIQWEERWDSCLIGQIHDEIVFDVNPGEREHVLETVKDVTTKRLLNEWKWIIVPLNVEANIFPVDHSWASNESQEIEL